MEEWQVKAREMVDRHYQEERRLQEALEDRRLLSIHEAGHAVVAEHFRMRVVRIIVIAPNKSVTEITDRTPLKETLLEDVAMSLGGYSAVLKETRDELVARVHCGIDEQFLYELFTRLEIDDREQRQLKTDGRAIAQQLIEKYWLAIKGIAEEVFEFTQISGQRVRQILSETPS
jgi:ATP-dependent Zn protease